MIDTHAHLYAEELDDQRTAIMQRAKEAGITKIVLPNVDSTTLQRMLNLEKEYPGYCYAAIGVHPTSIGENWKEELALVELELKRRNTLLQQELKRKKTLEEEGLKHRKAPESGESQASGVTQLSGVSPASGVTQVSDVTLESGLSGVTHASDLTPESGVSGVTDLPSASVDSADTAPPYIAIGEIGTDLYWDKKFLRQQQEAFAQQLQWSLDYRLPVIIHVRDSFDETFEVLQDFRGKGLRGVFHSFTGTIEQAHTINEFGTFYLGINGIITFKNSGLREVIASVSPERLVLETDSPYLSPAPFRGKLNESSRLPLIVLQLAAVYNLNPEKIVAITTKNAESLFNFKGKT